MGISCNIPSIGIDQFILPAFIAKTLPSMRNIQHDILNMEYNRLLEIVNESIKHDYNGNVTYVNRGYDEHTLERIIKWRVAIDSSRFIIL